MNQVEAREEERESSPASSPGLGDAGSPVDRTQVDMDDPRSVRAGISLRDDYWTYVEKRRLNAILNIVPNRRFEHGLDLGCGRGQFTIGLFAALGVRLGAGYDESEEGVLAARQRGVNAELMDLDRGRIPLEASSQDFVSMIETIEHLEDVEHCLDEVRRVLKPGGSLVITTPNLASWHGRISLALGFQPLSLDVGYRKHYGSLVTLSGKSTGHIRGFTRPALDDILESTGFHVTAWSCAPAVATGKSRKLEVLRTLDRVLSRFPNIASEIVVHALRRPDEISNTDSKGET